MLSKILLIACDANIRKIITYVANFLVFLKRSHHALGPGVYNRTRFQLWSNENNGQVLFSQFICGLLKTSATMSLFNFKFSTSALQTAVQPGLRAALPTQEIGDFTRKGEKAMDNSKMRFQSGAFWKNLFKA